MADQRRFSDYSCLTTAQPGRLVSAGSTSIWCLLVYISTDLELTKLLFILHAGYCHKRSRNARDQGFGVHVLRKQAEKLSAIIIKQNFNLTGS